MGKDSENGMLKKPKAAPLLCSCRLALFIVCLFATFNFLLQRLNISFALVCMVKRNVVLPDFILDNNGTETEADSILVEGRFFENVTKSVFGVGLDDAQDIECRAIAASNKGNSSAPDEGEFEWSKDVQGAILGSFFYGFIFTQVLGGWISERFGGRQAFLGSIASLSLLTLLNPIAAVYGPEYLFGVRLLQGLTHGAALPAINVFATRWCAPAERAFLMGIAYGGFTIAIVATFPLSGVLCTVLGWKWIFYVSGLSGLLLCVVAYFMVYDWPEDHPRISAVELEYLKTNRAVKRNSQSVNQKLNVPWKKIILSGPINVVHITHFCFVWGFNLIGMFLPTFLKEVLYMNTSENGLFSSLPYVGMMFIHFSVGSIFDFFRKKEFCSLTNLRKFFNTIGMVGPAVSMALIGFLSCTNPLGGIAAIAFGQIFGEFCFMGGYLFSIFELAPRYAGIITGVTNTFGVLPGFLCPIFVAYMTPNGTRQEWIVVFMCAAGLNIFGAVMYLLFGTTELQSWAAAPSDVQENGNGVADKEMHVVNEKLLTRRSSSSEELDKIKINL